VRARNVRLSRVQLDHIKQCLFHWIDELGDALGAKNHCLEVVHERRLNRIFIARSPMVKLADSERFITPEN
jgi:hypothetical protein